MFNRRGMTLMEILIVLLILGIVAGLAVPSFTRAMEGSRMNEAKVNLGILHMAQKIYRINNGTYWNGGTVNISSPTNALNTALGTEISAMYYPSVTVTGNATTYSATNARATGAAVDWTFGVTQTGQVTCAGTGCPCNPCV